MTIPAFPSDSDYSAGTYVWPSLQGDNGVFQAVCDGRSGSWWIGDGFYGTPSLAWGAGFSVSAGEQVYFTFNLANSTNSTWTTTLTLIETNETVSSTFDLDGDVLDIAQFAVELYGGTYDFGPTTYENITIVSADNASSWCTGEDVYSWGYYNNSQYTYGNDKNLFTLEGLGAEGNTCTIGTLIMPNATVF